MVMLLQPSLRGRSDEAIHACARMDGLLRASLADASLGMTLLTKVTPHCPANQPNPPPSSPSNRPRFDLLRAFGIRKCSAIPARPELPFLSRLARRHRLCAGLAGGLRGRHGRRLCAGHPQCRFRQPAFRRRRRQRARQHLYRAPQPDAAGDHRGPAGALDPALAAVPLRRARLGISKTLRQVQRRAGAARGRAGGDRARLLRGDAAALRADFRVGPDRRLDPSGAAAGSAQNQPRDRPRSGRDEGARRSACRPASALPLSSVPASIARRPSI